MVNGKINLLGKEQVMLSSEFLRGLQSIDEGLVYDLAKKIGLEDAKYYTKILDSGHGDLLGHIKMVFDTYGLGILEIELLKKEKATVRVVQSTLANIKKQSDKTVCTITAGLLAGFFSYLLKREVNCIEKKCKSMGNLYCVFEIK
ncbi:hypothetical protein HYW21_07645 [Candidatus Woesearchaeota archaeon]|nr:hypothetical protein [Candidatus Woesearchaeota archaeon]